MRPARTSSGGTWSTPAMTPLATAGAAPSTIIRTMADEVSPNTMYARGNHSTEGIVCIPVMSEPIPARSTGTRATAVPTTVPITTAMA
jgi:hypothetical protein